MQTTHLKAIPLHYKGFLFQTEKASLGGATHTDDSKVRFLL